MKASVIITSFNRPELLSFGLSSLERQNVPYDEVEFIVLNDGDPEDGTRTVCESFKDSLNIKYFESKNKKDKWRVPGYAINFGVKQSAGEYIFISCAEIYHMDNSIFDMLETIKNRGKVMVIPRQGKDDNGKMLNKLRDGKPITDEDYNRAGLLHNIHLPFFMGMRKSDFIDIGGYDEDFVGIGYDDNDFVERMQRFGVRHVKSRSRIVHLYHPRMSYGNKHLQGRIATNKTLYFTRKKIVKRNKNIIWGNNF